VARRKSARSFDVHGAMLNTQIDGHRLWNLDELRLVKRSTKK
jgi:hypothetical protein